MVASLAHALKAQGIQPGDRVMLVSENRPEFCIADLAIMAAGAVTVPTYTTNTRRDHEHIIANSGARAVIFSTAKIAGPLMPAVLHSNMEFAVAMEPPKAMQATSVPVHDWSALIAAHPADARASADALTATRDDTACIIYTSGTGGAPRGVILHHGSILCNVEGCVDIIANDFGWGDEVFLSFLPISHAYEHSGGQFLPIGLGGQIYYAESLEKLAANIAEVRPTIMVVVPRLFELLRVRVSKAIEKQGRLPALMLEQTLRLAEKRAERGSLSLWHWPLRKLLDRAFIPKIRKRFGGRLKALVSGGAPLNPEVGTFFQVKIADDGEILVRGELVMKGYWNNPAETARTIRDGWLHTGDIGEFDGDGRLRITDRKKDLIVNDKGDNIAPAKLENMLTLQPEIGQVMVYGDRRPNIVGLIVPDPDWAREWAQAHGKPADLTRLRDDPAFHAVIRAAVDRVNAELSVIEKVRRFILADEPFTIDNEMLTPKQSIRRHVIREHYQARLDALYGARTEG